MCHVVSIFYNLLIFCIKHYVFGLYQHKNMLLFPSQKYPILIPVTFPATASFFYSPLQQNSSEESPTNCLQFFSPVVSKLYSYSKLAPPTGHKNSSCQGRQQPLILIYCSLSISSLWSSIFLETLLCLTLMIPHSLGFFW